MRKTFKFRLFPTKAQCTAMNQTLEACRWVYNKILETRKAAWEEGQESLSLYDTIKMVPGWKKDAPFLKQAHSQVLQNVCVRVDLAFKAFFRRVRAGEKPGYPRFKGKGWYKSFTYPQSGFGLESGYLRLSRIGNARIRLHRPLEGQIKTLTIKRDCLGNWYACFSCEVEPVPLPPVPSVVGIDLGLEKFAAFSTGEYVENPRFFRKDEKALAKAQRRLSQREKDVPEYNKRKRVVQHIHQRIKNRRADFVHKLSRRLVQDFQILVFENLAITNMMNGNHKGMNKSIADAAWNQLVSLAAYKAESAGRSLILVDPRGTSQECSSCGAVVQKDLSVRVHRCPQCGLDIDRDLNAALNILRRGLTSVGVNP